MAFHAVGPLLIEGKTKQVFSDATSSAHSEHVIVVSKDDLTAGDGAKHDVIKGKARLANQTTCNVFRLLQEIGIPSAFIEQLGVDRFRAKRCNMILYEVVIRRDAHGSYLRRNPHLKKGHVFSQLIVEVFLKTSGKRWKEFDLPVDDPLIHFDEGCASLYLPNQPIWQQQPFLRLHDFPLKGEHQQSLELRRLALEIFLVLEKAWQLVGRRLVDFKVEFGIDAKGKLCLADVIDNDSWRVVEDGRYICKQGYRDNESLDEVTAKYEKVANLTERFTLPRQQIILWRGSETDDFKPFELSLNECCVPEQDCRLALITQSAHKQPMQVCQQVTRLVQEIPDTVIIAYVGRSNGLGPILAGQVSVPVISVPSKWEQFPQDVWSSLHLPSSVPAATILDPKNAVLHALQILALRNPRIYTVLQIKKEERLANFAEL